MERFLYIVDSYLDSDIHLELSRAGFVRDTDYSDSGAGGAYNLLHSPEWISATKLLVFTGSFHGSTDKAIEFALAVKKANPEAQIIFRSATEKSEHPVFNKSIEKEFGEFNVMMNIIRDYFEI